MQQHELELADAAAIVAGEGKRSGFDERYLQGEGLLERNGTMVVDVAPALL